NQLEEAGLIAREQRRKAGTNKQESTRYYFPFEPEFSEHSGKKPSPETGHGNTEAESRNAGEPSPENGDSRVQNLDSNLVREPVIEPVREREGASASEEGVGEDPKSLEREFKRWFPAWPTYVSDSQPDALKAWMRLSVADRLEAVAKAELYVAAVKAAGRSKVCSAAVYLSEKRWEKLDSVQAEKVRAVVEAKRIKASSQFATPFSKAWMANRLTLLLGPVSHTMPRMSAYQAAVMRAGGEAAEQLRLERLEKYGWPKVSFIDAQAGNAKGCTVVGAVVEAAEGFEKVHRDSEKAEAWAAVHKARGWPVWPDSGRHEWLYFPAIGDGETDLVAAAASALENFKAAARGTNDDAA
ncbi:hypothetical protein ACQ3G6_13160, partial [Allorhizobium undicola]|uniref:hypothetical protein n=1 Tax=Allorhizobium undicola TaxID=78527 RepID=UPI003D32F732